jgi:drug/metabolite transporter (DMT)-like permease
MQSALYYLSTILIWGSTWFAITFQLGATAESVSIFYRFLLASVLLFAFCVVRKKRLAFSLQEHFFIAAQGFCLFAFNYLLFYWCTRYITSGFVAVIFSTVVIMNIVNGALFLKKPIRLMVVAGAILGLIGIALVFSHELLDQQTAESSQETWKGLWIGLCATLCASFGNILSARNQTAALPVVQTNAFGMLYGSLIMLLYSLLAGHSFAIQWTSEYLLSLVYLSVFGSILAFGAYLSLIGKIGADKAAYVSVLFPIVALAFSQWFEGFEWSYQAMLGVVLVLLGNVLVIGRKPLRDAFVALKR